MQDKPDKTTRLAKMHKQETAGVVATGSDM
jgi:hypothetical protein